MSLAHHVLRSFPGAALRFIIAARTAALKLAGPLDALSRAETPRAPLPPLWLRRHSGPLGAVESSVSETIALVKSMDLVRPDDTVLDVGCGPGLMAPELGRMLGPDGKYVGLDIQRASVRWCRERFRRERRFRFEVVDAGGSGFPVADWSGGFILAKSVFTHLTEKQARACLTEIRRALAPGRTAMITGFLFNGAAGGSRSAPYFPFSNAEGTVRWRWRTRPSSAIAFDRAMFEGLIEGCGLRVALFRPGFWPGAAEPTGQDTLFLVHREAEISSARRDAAKTP